MVVIRTLAWLLILCGIGLFGHALVELLRTGSFQPLVFAQVVLWVDQSAQLGFSHFLERNLGVEFYQSVAIPYFWGAAAYAVFLVPGALLWLIARPRYRE